MDKSHIYHSDPDIMGGTLVFTGTRVPVDSLIAHLKAGDSLEQFLDPFPSVSFERTEWFLKNAPAHAHNIPTNSEISPTLLPSCSTSTDPVPSRRHRSTSS